MEFKILLFTLLFSSFAFNQKQTIVHSFDSKTFKTERTISIHLPTEYETDTSQTYTVAYVFDGQFQPYFDMISSIMEYYSQTNEGVPMIIVGIHTADRWREFVPNPNEAQNISGTDLFRLSLSEEIIPYIEKNYRTKAYRFVIGHSLGGTFVINEISSENSLFDGALAVSPNLTMYDEQIVHQTSKYFINNQESNRHIWTSIGTQGEMEINFQKSLIHLDSLINTNLPAIDNWNFEIIEGANHMTTFISTFEKTYLALSSKLTLLDNKLVQIAQENPSNLIKALSQYYVGISLFSKEEKILNFNDLESYANTLYNYKEFEGAYEIYLFASIKLGDKISEDVKKTLENKLEYSKFHSYDQKATKLSNEGQFIEASLLYDEAFAMDLIRATHVVRMKSIPVYAQAEKQEEAFKQLELLVNKFKLGGNLNFINDPLCNPLKMDPRWKKYMDGLEENAKLY